MRTTPPDLLKYRSLSAAVFLFLTTAHGVHDVFSGSPLLPAFLLVVTTCLQVAALSIGQERAGRWGWSRGVTLTVASLVNLAFGVAHIALHSIARPITPIGWLFASAGAGMGVFGLWLLVFYLPSKLYQAQARAFGAEAGLRKAELAQLRSNLQPHFLLNTLNAVAGLLVVEPKQARQLVSALGDLLRDSLEDGGEMRPLEQEVEWLRRYAEIFEIRHRGSIRFEWDLSAETLAMSLPRLLLQPLLENAIEHGALRRPGGGTVTLRCRTAGDMIQIVVSDNGPGMKSDRPSGLGLRLVEDRLQLAYSTASMKIDTSQAGTCVTLELPKTEKPR